MKIRLATLLCLVSGLVIGQNQDSLALKYANTITADEMSRHLHVLASDAYQGRETGKEGQKMAMEFLVNYFKETGFKPVVEYNYIQQYPLVEQMADGISLTINNKKYQFFEDFFSFPSITPSVNFNTDIVFGGFGITDGKWDDYKNIDVTNKIVLLFDGSPKKGKLEKDWTIKDKIELAKNKGARAIFVTVKDYDTYVKKYDHYIKKAKMDLKSNMEEEGFVPVFRVNDQIKKDILSANGVKEKKYLKGKTIKQKQFTKANLVIEKETNEFFGENVLAYIEGTEKPDELIIVTAHYDHIGANSDVVFNGADDDGSGTVALMELAQAFKMASDQGNGPKRSILFMPVSGEEKGLLGSEYYSKNPVFPLEQTVANLNVDMIGRLDEAHEGNPNFVYLIGSDKLSSDLHQISENANETYTKLELDYTFNDENDPNRFYYRSDHYNFAKNNIPVIFYFCGVHEDYHKETDTVEKIQFDKMETITKLIFHTAWDLANRNERIIVDSDNK
jgi:hypothetical protein